MNPLLPLALLGLGFGYADSEIARFERAAAHEISQKLGGESRTVEVHAVPEGLSLAWGRLESATITAKHFSLDQLPFFTEPWRSTKGGIGTLILRLNDFVMRGLRVDELSADIPDCRYDLGLARGQQTFRVSRSGEGTGRVRIQEQALATYIVAKYAEIKSATVRVYNDVVWVEGYGEFLIVNTRFAVIAKLTTPDGYKLELTDAKVYFDWHKAEPAAAKVILDLLNPVVDLYDGLGLYDAMRVTDITLRDGVLTATGRARIPLKPTSPNDR